MTSNNDNLNENVQQMDALALTKAITSLTKKIAQLEKTNSQLTSSNSQLRESVLRLEITQIQNQAELKASHLNFLQQLADTLNSKKSSSLEPTLQSLTTALQTVSSQLQEQKKLAKELPSSQKYLNS